MKNTFYNKTKNKPPIKLMSLSRILKAYLQSLLSENETYGIEITGDLDSKKEYSTI